MHGNQKIHIQYSLYIILYQIDVKSNFPLKIKSTIPVLYKTATKKLLNSGLITLILIYISL